MDQSSVSMLAEAISHVFPQEASIAIADDSRYIYYQPSTSVDLKIKPGDSIREGSLTRKALQAKQKVAQQVDGEIFGIPYYGFSIPIADQEEHKSWVITAIFPRPLERETMQIRPSFLVGKRDDRWFPLRYEEIIYIQSHEGKTLLYTEGGVYSNKFSMTELQQILPAGQFVRCHRSFFVNVSEIAEIHPDFHSTFILILKDKQRSRIPVSQSHASAFRRLLGF